MKRFKKRSSDFSFLFFALVVLVAGSTFAPRAAQAQGEASAMQYEQASDLTQGFFVGAHLAGHRVAYEDAHRENGIGGGIEVGYGLNEYVGVFLAFEGAELGSAESRNTRYSSGYFDIGIEGTLPTGSAAVPFARVAYSGASATVGTTEYDFAFSLDGFTAEGGARYFVSESLALTGSVTYLSGTYDALGPPGAEGEQNFDNLRLGVGAVFYPF